MWPDDMLWELLSLYCIQKFLFKWNQMGQELLFFPIYNFGADWIFVWNRRRSSTLVKVWYIRQVSNTIHLLDRCQTQFICWYRQLVFMIHCTIEDGQPAEKIIKHYLEYYLQKLLNFECTLHTDRWSPSSPWLNPFPFVKILRWLSLFNNYF